MKWIEVKLENKEGVVVQQPLEYRVSPPNHKQEISLKGRANHRKAMLNKRYL